MVLSISSTRLLEAIMDAVDENLTDATCVVMNCDYDTWYREEFPELTPEQFVKEQSRPKEAYVINNWVQIREAIANDIGRLKGDDIELSRYIRGILQALDDRLHLFYTSLPRDDWSVFQRLVPYLRFYQQYDTLPEDLVTIHREEILQEMQLHPDKGPQNLEEELKKRCDITLRQLNNADNIPCFCQCRYFHRQVFWRLAVIIESYLLEYHCKKDLFAYQKECDIILCPQLTASDIAAERGVTTEYVKENWSDGYEILDAYTEFADYGAVKTQVSAFGVDYIGIPELDALLAMLADNNCRYYPKHHLERNRVRFEKRCKELADSKMPDEEKRAKLINMVQIVTICYTGFLHFPELNQYLSVVINYFTAIERAFMKAPHQICIKQICMELGSEDLLTDEFPDTPYHRDIWKERGKKPEGRWSEYYLKVGLQSTLHYHENRLCGPCTVAECPYRKAGAKHVNKPVSKRLSAKEEKKLICNGLRQICIFLASKGMAGLTSLPGNKNWRLKDARDLYAYIGFALKLRYNASQIPWEEMFPILQTECNSGDLKPIASKYKSMREGKIKENYPAGYELVDEAIGNIAA